jgi:hypothetical protein
MSWFMASEICSGSLALFSVSCTFINVLEFGERGGIYIHVVVM